MPRPRRPAQALGKAPAVTEPLAKSMGHGRLSWMPMAVRWAPGHPLWKVMAGGTTGGRVKTPQVSLGWEGGDRAAGPLGQRKGGSPLPGTSRPEFAGLGCLGSIFQAFKFTSNLPGCCHFTEKKTENPETVTTPRATGRPLSNTLQPALPSTPSLPRFPSSSMPTLAPKAGRGREPQTQLHSSNNGKHFPVGSGFCVPATPCTPLPLILQLPSTLGTMRDPFHRCRRLAQSPAHLVHCQEKAERVLNPSLNPALPGGRGLDPTASRRPCFSGCCSDTKASLTEPNYLPALGD